jgi:predicted regulator of Ras-like GTPase activity (Roadblock/LC7/MglB family)
MMSAESMQDKRAEISSVLNKLLGICGCESVMILSQKGHLVGLKYKNGSTPNQTEGFFSEFINTSIKIVSKTNFGDIDSIFIQDTERKMIIRSIPEKSIFVILWGSSRMNSQSANVEVKKTASLL